MKASNGMSSNGMSSNTALAIRQPDPDTWSMITAIAAAAKASAKLGVLRPEEAAMKMLTAWENGLPLTSAFSAVYLIDGKPSLAPKVVLGKIMTHPDFAGYEEERLTDNQGAFHGWRITLKRKNGMKIVRQFTLDDAKTADLHQKDNWKKYPENMCLWRAVDFAADVCFPDITLGIVRADELGAAVDGGGNVVEGSWEIIEERIPTNATEQPNVVTLQELAEQYGVQAIMAVAGGKIPGTQEEIEQAAAKLAAVQA